MAKKDLDPIEFEDQKSPLKSFAGFEIPVLARMAIAALAFILALFLRRSEIVRLVLLLVCFLAAGYDVVTEAAGELLQSKRLNTAFLIAVASLVSFITRHDFDAAALMLIYRLCRLVLDYVIRRTKNTVMQSIDPCPKTAQIVVDGVQTAVDVSAVKAGDTLVLQPGDYACADCVVTEGYTAIDASALTGDAEQRNIEEGDLIPAGAVNITSQVQAEVLSAPSESAMARSRAVIAKGSGDPSRIEILTARYEKLFAPVALGVGVIYALLVGLIGHLTVGEALHRGLILPAIAAPGAFLLSIPLTYFVGIAGAARKGVLVRSNGKMDALSRSKAALLDKDGTITTGEYQLSTIKSPRMDSDILLKLAAHASANAVSKEAAAVVKAYGGALNYSIIGDFLEETDGVSVSIEGIPVLLGSREFISGHDISVEGERESTDGKTLYIALGGHYAGTIYLTDVLQTNSAAAVGQLEGLGCEDVVLLSEDSAEKTRSLAQRAGISKFYPQCWPMDKLSRVQEMCERTGKDSTLFVGGPKADAAVMAAADVGVALGGLRAGSIADAADVVAMDGNIEKVAHAVSAAKETDRVMRQGALLALGVKALLLLLSLTGLSNQLWFAVLLDGCASIACALNAIRALPLNK